MKNKCKKKCFFNIKAYQHILLHQIHKIMIVLKTSYDPFKWMKWTLNRIKYYYKTLYSNLHHFNVAVGQCERHLSNSVYYCKYYQPSTDTLTKESHLASTCFSLLTRLILIIWYTIYIYIYIYIYAFSRCFYPKRLTFHYWLYPV